MKVINEHLGVILFFILLFIGFGFANLQIDIKKHTKKTARKKRGQIQ